MENGWPRGSPLTLPPPYSFPGASGLAGCEGGTPSPAGGVSGQLPQGGLQVRVPRQRPLLSLLQPCAAAPLRLSSIAPCQASAGSREGNGFSSCDTLGDRPHAAADDEAEDAAGGRAHGGSAAPRRRKRQGQAQQQAVQELQQPAQAAFLAAQSAALHAAQRQYLGTAPMCYGISPLADMLRKVEAERQGVRARNVARQGGPTRRSAAPDAAALPCLLGGGNAGAVVEP